MIPMLYIISENIPYKKEHKNNDMKYFVVVYFIKEINEQSIHDIIIKI
jgi:hypothetical protein